MDKYATYFYVSGVGVQTYPMRLGTSKDETIDKTVNNVNDVTFKIIRWLFH